MPSMAISGFPKGSVMVLLANGFEQMRGLFPYKTYEGCPKTLVYNFRLTKTKYNIICQKPRARKHGARLAQGFENAHAISFIG